MENFIPESYIPTHDFQMSSSIEVETKDGRKMSLAQAQATHTPIIKAYLKPVGGLLYNTTYMICAEPGIQSITGKTLKERNVFQFTGSYGPLYSTPTEVHSVLKGLYEHFTMHEIYSALRDAGQKAHIILKYYPDINSPRFRPILEVRLEYFPMTKVVIYQAALDLLSDLYAKLSEKLNIGDTNQNFSTDSSVKLGDFSANDKIDWQHYPTGIMSVLRATMSEVNKELQFWTQNLLNRNRRGFAKPIAAAMRSQNGATPDDRSI